MKRFIGVLVVAALLAGIMPSPAHARIGKGKLALIAGASVAACTAGIIMAANQKDRFISFGDYGWRWDAKRVAAASIGAGALVGGLTFVFMASREGHKFIGIRFPLGAK